MSCKLVLLVKVLRIHFPRALEDRRWSTTQTEQIVSAYQDFIIEMVLLALRGPPWAGSKLVLCKHTFECLSRRSQDVCSEACRSICLVLLQEVASDFWVKTESKPLTTARGPAHWQTPCVRRQDKLLQSSILKQTGLPWN